MTGVGSGAYHALCAPAGGGGGGKGAASACCVVLGPDVRIPGDTGVFWINTSRSRRTPRPRQPVCGAGGVLGCAVLALRRPLHGSSIDRGQEHTRPPGSDMFHKHRNVGQ
jgi:hypothetical protein